MDIAEFKEKRAELERDIYAVNKKLIDDFQDKTGLKVSDITIYLMDIATIGQPDRSIISDVNVSIDI